jgi:hypothetical protein
MTQTSRIVSRESIEQLIREKLHTLYGEEKAKATFDAFPAKPTSSDGLPISEKDSMLITYGDHVKRVGENPLATLNAVLQGLSLPISSVHILPFYPYSSDDGFSVIDYYAVDSNLGTWEDVRRLGENFRLMFDAVFNHISAKSAWFQDFLKGTAPYTDR